MLLNNAQAAAATQSYLVPVDPRAATASRRQLRHVVGDALERGERHIVMDCAELDGPDVVMLSTLMRCAELCAHQGAGFQLTNLNVSVHDTLRELKLTTRLGLAE
jgi:anti-anti-sigma regulatory factor